VGPPDAGHCNARRADSATIGPGDEPGSGFRRVTVFRVCWRSGCGQVVGPVAELGFGPGGEVGDEYQQVGGGVLGFGRREADGGGGGVEGGTSGM
jgi:hypothetical protein